jgi:hypothetical protein
MIEIHKYSPNILKKQKVPVGYKWSPPIPGEYVAMSDTVIHALAANPTMPNIAYLLYFTPAQVPRSITKAMIASMHGCRRLKKPSSSAWNWQPR